MAGIRLWSPSLPSWFDGLEKHLSSIAEEISEFDLSDRIDEGAIVVLAMVGETDAVSAGLEWMRRLDAGKALNLIVVTVDSHLGSDSSRELAEASGAVISAMRSLAVQRGTKVRANAICLPEWTAGVQDSNLRGPLSQQPELEDLADAIGFLAGPDAGYLSGQVLFVDSGRQLFSSHTS